MKNISQYIKNRKTTRILLFLLLLLPLIALSYANVEESVSVVKYHFHADTHKLIKNYHLYCSSFKEFFSQTLSFHQGDSQSGWSTAYYLFPLFTFLKIVGGLSLKNLYLFNITTFIISLFLFYYWARRYWNKRIAFFATFLFGYSAVFQEFARSGSYISSSIPIAIIWIICMYICMDTKKPFPYFFLGIITGIAMYGYSLLRSLTLVPLYILFVRKDMGKKRWFLFLAGCLVFVLPGIILKLSREFTGFNHNFSSLFVDEEVLLINGQFLKDFLENIGYFFNRILGGAQLIEHLCANNYHAHFLNRILLIPFFIGFLRILKYRKEQNYRLLLIISFLIFFVPMSFTSSVGYREARRSVLYLIPIYLYIGVGVETIFNFVGSIKNRIARQISFWGTVCLILFIISSEVLYVKSFILNNTRDVGVLAFAKDVKEQDIKGAIYYFEPYPWDNWRFQFYEFTDLSVLELALMGGKNNSFELRNIRDLDEVAKNLKDFYVIIKNYVIFEDEFKQLCQSRNLYPQLLVVSNLRNFGDMQKRHPELFLKDHSLELFKVSRH